MAENYMNYVELGADIDQDADGWDGSQAEFPSFGEHVFEIIGVLKEPSKGGTPMAVVSLEVVEGDEKGRTIKAWYPLTVKARGRIINLCNAVGVRLDERGGFDLDTLVGGRLMASVVENRYSVVDAQTQERVEKTNSKVMFEKPLPPPAKAGKASERLQRR